ncbi:SAM-dependent methyltransferase [Mycobacterium sp. 1100029.7]|nr:SAM-dependent methyltransferase [Mycobacterium sp. 1100029.7]
MTRTDQHRWDERYTVKGPAALDAVGPPRAFAAYEHVFPAVGTALDLACGQGGVTVWLAQRGLRAAGWDISAVAVGQARELARYRGVEDRCRFGTADLDDGLPDGPPADVIVCHRFRDRRLDRAIIDRLAPGGLLATVALSEVDAAPGPFRAAAGELTAAFAGLDVIVAGEGQGQAWLLARARS